jgi:hypothetical protein
MVGAGVFGPGIEGELEAGFLEGPHGVYALG